MGALVLTGDTSGSVTVNVPTVAGTNTATFPAATGTVMVSGNMPAFSAYQSSAQALGAGTLTLCQLQTEEFDTASCFNNTGATVGSIPAYAFLPNVAGYYQVSAAYQLVGAAVCFPNLYKNGSAFKIGANTTGANVIGLSMSTLVYLNGTTDYIQFYVYSNSAQNTTSGQSSTWFQANLVRNA